MKKILSLRVLNKCILFFAAMIPCIANSQTDLWQKTSEPAAYVFSIAASNAGYVFVRAPTIYYTSDGGASWVQSASSGVPDAGGGNPICISPSGYIVAGGYDQVAVSGDTGKTWSTQYTTYDYTGATVPIMALTYNPLTKTVWAGTFGDGLHQIDANGWYIGSSAFGQIQNYQGSELADITSVFYDSLSGYLFASFYSGGAERSSDNGQSWNAVSTGNSNMLINTWASVANGGIFAGTWAGVFRSTDKGATFSPADTTQLDDKVTALATGSDGQLFAGTYKSGVFRSTDYGESWEQITAGLQGLYISSLCTDRYGYLYAGTLGGGLYKSTLAVLSVKKDFSSLPNRFLLSQNYPNPFNPSTMISYQLPADGYVTLKVFDILGREVRTLVNERQIAGDYSVIFNASSLPSGVYFDRLEARNSIETKKMVLMK